MTLTLFSITALALLGYMGVWSFISITKKRADLADIAWGGGFLILCWLSLIFSKFSIEGLLIDLCVSIWAIRLIFHIYLRNRNREEDFRYKRLKKSWRSNENLNIFLKVFLLQGIILYVIGLPILWIHAYSAIVSKASLIAALSLWTFGFILEVVADHQLSAFKKNPNNRNHLLQTGLWSYSRHPNYLGEIIQWWAIWSVAATLPYGLLLIASPLLITYLIVNVSGIEPLEKKMTIHPDFRSYAMKTPMLAPISSLNGVIYSLSWFLIVFYGGKGAFFIPLGTAIGSYWIQLYLLAKTDKNLCIVSIPLSFYALLFGFIQEMLFIHFPFIVYPNQGSFPPLWLLTLYPLFSLCLNSTFFFLNRNLFFSFCIGGILALFSYYCGEIIGAAQLVRPIAYLAIPLCWGAFLTILLLLNRKLIQLKEKYRPSNGNLNPISVFFDGQCPICSHEMDTLKKRKQTGEINYLCPLSDTDLKEFTPKITYSEAMKKIHAIDRNGNIFTGIDALSEIYARTDLVFLAILLQAPGFHLLFRISYAIWASLRLKLRR